MAVDDLGLRLRKVYGTGEAMFVIWIVGWVLLGICYVSPGQGTWSLFGHCGSPPPVLRSCQMGVWFPCYVVGSFAILVVWAPSLHASRNILQCVESPALPSGSPLCALRTGFPAILSNAIKPSGSVVFSFWTLRRCSFRA